MPSLNALKAFEAAARHQSFARAADELGVTPAAISHQVKALEDSLGYVLFVRHAQGLQLTDAGRNALPRLTAAFDALGLAVQDLRNFAPRTQISIAALPSVAQLWLAPQLGALRVAFPNTVFSVHALEDPPDLRREPFDLAVFFLQKDSALGSGMEVAHDEIYPVCSPSLAAGLTSPEQLSGQVLLHDTAWSSDWSLWLKAAGVRNVAGHRGPAFSLYSLALQTALEGGGVLMGHASLVEAYVQRGQLAAPFSLKVATGLKLMVIQAERPHPTVADIGMWLANIGPKSSRIPNPAG